MSQIDLNQKKKSKKSKQLAYLMAYKVHIFRLKIFFKIPCVSYDVRGFNIHDNRPK